MIVRVVGTMDLPDERRDAVLEALPEHIDLTRSEQGCLTFNIEIEANHLSVEEIFTDDAAFKAHQARVFGTQWAVVTVGLERHYEISTSAK
jgi:quinol monooxygenase YgiN